VIYYFIYKIANSFRWLAFSIKFPWKRLRSKSAYHSISTDTCKHSSQHFLGCTQYILRLLAGYLVQSADEIDESAAFRVTLIIGTSIKDMQLYKYHLLKPTGQNTRLLDHPNVTLEFAGLSVLSKSAVTFFCWPGTLFKSMNDIIFSKNSLTNNIKKHGNFKKELSTSKSYVKRAHYDNSLLYSNPLLKQVCIVLPLFIVPGTNAILNGNMCSDKPDYIYDTRVFSLSLFIFLYIFFFNIMMVSPFILTNVHGALSRSSRCCVKKIQWIIKFFYKICSSLTYNFLYIFIKIRCNITVLMQTTPP